jgi:hypothetical protein
MKYIQWLGKGFARFPLFFIGITSILACASLPSAALALGIATTTPVATIGSDSSKVKAFTSPNPRKYSCTAASTDSSLVTKVTVPCSGTALASDTQNNYNYACPAGQVVVGSGTVDQGKYTTPPHFYNCGVAPGTKGYETGSYMNCPGNTNYNYIYGSYGTSRYTSTLYLSAGQPNSDYPYPLYCWSNNYCSWGGGVWASKPSCYVSCVPESSCQWQ